MLCIEPGDAELRQSVIRRLDAILEVDSVPADGRHRVVARLQRNLHGSRRFERVGAVGPGQDQLTVHAWGKVAMVGILAGVWPPDQERQTVLLARAMVVVSRPDLTGILIDFPTESAGRLRKPETKLAKTKL